MGWGFGPYPFPYITDQASKQDGKPSQQARWSVTYGQAFPPGWSVRYNVSTGAVGVPTANLTMTVTNSHAPRVLRVPVSRATVRRCRAVRYLHDATRLAWWATRSFNGGTHGFMGCPVLFKAWTEYQWPIWC